MASRAPARLPGRGVFCSPGELTAALERRIELWNAAARALQAVGVTVLGYPSGLVEVEAVAAAAA